MARSSISVTWEHLNLELSFNEKRVMKKVASAIAKAHKKNLRKGKDSTGEAIKTPKAGNKPLKRTGRLLKSIKGYTSIKNGRHIAIVGATGTREDLGSSLRGRNAGLLAVQVAGLRTEASRPRNSTLMKLSPSLKDIAVEAFDEALDKEFAEGRASIIRGTRSRGLLR